MGYAGGTTPSPTYRTIADHAEAVRVGFEPSVLGLDVLLERFWAGHDPFFCKASQYRAELYCEDQAQAAVARASAERIEAEHGRAVETRILVGQTFHPAEAYHQKWSLRRHAPLFDDLRRHYASEPGMLASTAAAKLNAYVRGHGRASIVLEDLGLSPRGLAYARGLWPRPSAVAE